ncbi:MAG: glutathione peroxidase [Magnetovibrionaceae bacterium]
MTSWLKAAALGVGLTTTAGIANADVGSSAFDFSFPSIEGETIDLKSFEGKAILVVNTASNCGFTHHYEGLQALYADYRDRGLVVLGVPSNDFGGQEPGTETEIKEFCEVTFGVEFPMTAKQKVKGEDAHPFYRWAGETLGFAAKPRWNFHKYLVAPDGTLADWFSTATNPKSEKVKAAIEKLLPEG